MSHFLIQCHDTKLQTPKLDFLVSNTMLILCAIFLGPLSVECGCISAAFHGQRLQSDFEFSFEIFNVLTKLSQKHLNRQKLKIRTICGLTEIQFLNGTLWWPMIAIFCLISFLILFICLFNFFVLFCILLIILVSFVVYHY